MVTQHQLAISRTIRRWADRQYTILRRTLRRLMDSHKDKIIRLALANRWDELTKILNSLAIKAQPILAMAYGRAIKTTMQGLGARVKKQEDIIDPLEDLVDIDLYNPRIIGYLEGHGLELSKTIAEGLKAECLASLSEGYRLGESIPKIRRRLAETLDGYSRVRLDTIARTEIMRASQQGAIEGYQQSGVHEVEWLAAVDERTCPDCEELNGHRFGLSEVPDLPHPDCRCTVVPVV